MTQTDTTLKQYFANFGKELAEWLLNTTIKTARALSGELPPTDNTVYADYVLELTLLDNSQIIFHIEFQGRRSKRPLPWRMLEYDSRLAEQKQLPVCSAIIYLGHGAGSNDKGKHRKICPISGKVNLQWQYKVLHLWRWKPEQLLALNRPVLLPLIGQTKISHPERIFSQVLSIIRTQPDPVYQERLLNAFLSLLNEEDWLTMIEQLIKDDSILNTPFMRRQQAWLQQGEIEATRKQLLRLTEKRFGTLPMWAVEKVTQTTDKQVLEAWVLRVLDADKLADIFVE